MCWIKLNRLKLDSLTCFIGVKEKEGSTSFFFSLHLDTK
jgi:hypothetical protein